MKKGAHPQYQDITFTCACGATFKAGSTIQGDFKTEICSNCHPFFTGKQKLIDTSGRVDKFVAKMKKAQALAEKKVKKVKKTDFKDIKEDMEEIEEVNEELDDNVVELKKKEEPKEEESGEEEELKKAA